MNMSRQRPGWFEKLSYGSGDFGFNLYWTTITASLLKYYTDSFGLAAGAAGTMLLATKIVDACVDPMVGGMADRTKSKWGRFRPWLLWGGVPLAILGVIAFTVPPLHGSSKLIYAYVTFSLLMIAYSVANIPYGALSGVITNDPRTRTQINSFRFVGAFIGGTFVTYLSPQLVAYLGHGNDGLGWQLTMGACGIFALMLFLNLFFQVRERVEPLSEKAENPLKDISDLLRNRPWLIMFGLSMIVMVTIATRAGASLYYVDYVMGDKSQEKYFVPVYLAALAVGSLLTPVLSSWMEKRRLMIVLMIAVAALCFAFYFVPPTNLPLVYGLHIAIGLCLGPKSPLTFAMYADSADYNEYRTGRRATAMTFAAASFSQKLGGALASAVIGWVLAALGYIANTVQTGASQGGIILLMSVVPGVLALVAAVLMLFYNLSDARLIEIQDALFDRKAR